MKKFILLLVAALMFAGTVSAQDTTPVNPAEIGNQTAQQKLKTVSVTKFEDAGFWKSYMPREEGIIKLRRFKGGPLAKDPIDAELAAGIEEDDIYVLGGKISYFRRGLNHFSIYPLKPLPVEGLVKTLSLWVCGRNYNHALYVEVRDYYGNKEKLYIGNLNFSGWKKLTVTIPPTIKQRNFHDTNKMGIEVLGFTVHCDLEETWGEYYVYFDDLRAVTDLFAEGMRDPDDMPDSW